MSTKVENIGADETQIVSRLELCTCNISSHISLHCTAISPADQLLHQAQQSTTRLIYSMPSATVPHQCHSERHDLTNPATQPYRTDNVM